MVINGAHHKLARLRAYFYRHEPCAVRFRGDPSDE
jgi:hypothetical protein